MIKIDSNQIHFIVYCDNLGSWSCKARSGRECHFPFRMNDGNYTNKCEDIGYDNNLRCALRQSDDDQGFGSLTSHGICGDTCPGGT